jgi:signal transduction histidine kinase
MEAFPGFEQTTLFSTLRRCIDERMSITMENEFVFPDGSAGIFELRIQPVPEGLFILSNDISDRKRAEGELAERARLSMFATEVSSFLNREEPSSRLLQRFTEAIVSQTGVAFARIWIMGSGDLCKDCYKANLCKDRTQCLHLHSSAGLSTNLNGEYRRIPLGALKIGQIAQGAGCMTTNDILQDERLPNKEWMRENGLRSFAGYPLVVEGRVYGVLAVFGREPLSTVALQTLESVCHGLATAIARKQAEETLHHNERELRRQQTQLQDLASKLIATQERERQRIASDLHDDVSQRLAALVLDIAALEQQPPLYPERIADALLPLREQLEGLSDDIHNLAYRLHPTLLEHAGLQPAVEDHIHQVTQRTGLRIILDTGDLSGWLSLDQATGLFRVLQESLQNIVKHANATDVMVRLSGSPKGFGLSVTDNGRGFDATDNNTHQKGLGLISMQERLRLLNGFLRIYSRPAEGTKVCAWIPAKEGET